MRGAGTARGSPQGSEPCSSGGALQASAVQVMWGVLSLLGVPQEGGRVLLHPQSDTVLALVGGPTGSAVLNVFIKK